MPFRLPFNMPYFFNPNYRYTYNSQPNMNKNNIYKNTEIATTNKKSEDSSDKRKLLSEDSSEYLFEIFGLKLYFDDILIMCILFFLYTEKVQDQELFLCLILLLLS
ncbi:MAG: hypothetical protein HFJ17_00165 [Clostridia bacterium]|nr:hypothetical protein [Clostridia bacterium]